MKPAKKNARTNSCTHHRTHTPIKKGPPFGDPLLGGYFMNLDDPDGPDGQDGQDGQDDQAYQNHRQEHS